MRTFWRWKAHSISCRVVANTLANIARGMKRDVLDADRRFLVNLAHGGRVEDIAEPLRTITGAHLGEKALAAPSLSRFNGGATGSDLCAPAQTITAKSWIKRPGGAAPLGLLAPSLMSLKGTARRDSALTSPHPTVLAGGGHSALIEPVLTYAQQGGACRPATQPHSTVYASRKDQNAVITPTLAQQPLASFFAKYYGTGDRTDAPCHTIAVKDLMAHVQAALQVPPFSQEARTPR
jgi:DNA (cytosine-5)-methyltransferase 1